MGQEWLLHRVEAEQTEQGSGRCRLIKVGTEIVSWISGCTKEPVAARFF